MKRLLVGLLALGSISVFAEVETQCEVAIKMVAQTSRAAGVAVNRANEAEVNGERQTYALNKLAYEANKTASDAVRTAQDICSSIEE